MNTVWIVLWGVLMNLLAPNWVYATDAVESPLPNSLLVRVETQLTEMKRNRFPQLSQANIEIKAINSPSVFLATDIQISSLLMGERQYVLYVNPKLETAAITDFALRGILAHELVHFLDYETMNIAELAWFYANYLSRDEYVAEYERNTDLQAFELGYALGIKHFRFWLYEQISETEKDSKIKNYYTPEQIDNWLLDNLNQGEVTIL